MKSGISRLSTIFAMAALTLVAIAPAFVQTPAVEAKPNPQTIDQAKKVANNNKAYPVMKDLTREQVKKANDTNPFPVTKEMLHETDNGKRIVRLEGEINEATAKNIINQLLALDKADPGKPILMLINSLGGSVRAGFDIIDTMESLQSPVYTTGYSHVASMAAVILASGESGHRTAFASTNILFHEISAQIEGKISEQEALLQDEHRTEDRLLEILAEHSGQSKEDILAFIKGRDMWVSADAAKKLGFIDTVEKSTHTPVPPKHIQPIRTFQPGPG